MSASAMPPADTTCVPPAATVPDLSTPPDSSSVPAMAVLVESPPDSTLRVVPEDTTKPVLLLPEEMVVMRW